MIKEVFNGVEQGREGKMFVIRLNLRENESLIVLRIYTLIINIKTEYNREASLLDLKYG